MTGYRRPQKEAPSTPDWLFYLFLIAFALEYSGLPNQYPVLKAFRLTTILTYLCTIITIGKVGFGDLFKHREGKLLVAFLVFTAASMMWAVVAKRAFDSIRPFFDYLILFYLAANLIDRPKRYKAFGVVLCFIAVWLIKQNLSRLGQEVRAGAFSAAYFMGDGNDFAWGLAVMLPFALYLFLASKNIILKAIGAGGMLMLLFGIIGTSSRGGTIGVSASVLFYWFFMAKRKALGVVAIVIAVIGVLILAPSSYTSRMAGLSDTSADSSAQARITTWKASMKMAIDHPLGVGAGNFSSAYGRFYIGAGNPALGSSQNRWFSAHSIYFRTVGEYGYLGVTLLIWLILTVIIDNMKVRKRLIDMGDKAPILSIWPSVVAMSTIAYAACGTFLGGLSYPHIFLLCGITVANKRHVGGMLEKAVAKVKGRPGRRVAQQAAPIP